MPEPELKQNPPVTPSAEDKTAENIIRGVREGVKAALAEMPKPAAAPAPVLQQQAPLLSRPSAEQVADAIEKGNKDEVAKLLRQRDAYDEQRSNAALGNLSSQGGAAISSIARTSATGLPYYKRFKKDIDGMVNDFLSANPSAMATPEVYERAHDIVKGQHIDEIIAETREEAIRKAREPEAVLEPTNDRGERIAPEPTSLSQVLVGNWKKDLREKNGTTRSRNDDEELRSMGYRGGFTEFMTARKEMARVEEETNGSFGLDRDWVWTDKSKNEGHWIN